MQTLSRRRVAAYAATQLIEQPHNVTTLAKQLAAYLVTYKQVRQAELLIQDIQACIAERYGLTSAVVTTATPLTTALRETITAFLRQKTGNQQVVLTEHVDASIIGGLTIRTTDQFFDGSVRTQLQQLTAVTKDKE